MSKLTKLTLNADAATIEKAKRLAADQGTSVSAMFTQMIEAMSNPHAPPLDDLGAPITQQLRGLARVAADIRDRELYEASILQKGSQ